MWEVNQTNKHWSIKKKNTAKKEIKCTHCDSVATTSISSSSECSRCTVTTIEWPLNLITHFFLHIRTPEQAYYKVMSKAFAEKNGPVQLFWLTKPKTWCLKKRRLHAHANFKSMLNFAHKIFFLWLTILSALSFYTQAEFLSPFHNSSKKQKWFKYNITLH